MLLRAGQPLPQAAWRARLLAGLLAAVVGSSTHAEADFTYTVVAGDNPWSITERLLVDLSHWRRLVAYNKITDDRRIVPGTILKIPVSWLKLTATAVQIEQTSGQVEVMDGQSWRAARTGGQLAVGVRIRTARDSTATLRLQGGSTAVLLEQSEACIESTGQVVASGATLIRLALMRGRIESHAEGLRTPGSRFDITTPAATTSVRGTVFRVSTEGDNTRTEVISGKVVVGNTVGDVHLSDATGTRAEKGQPPSAPRPLLPAPDLTDMPASVLNPPRPLGQPQLAGALRFRTQILQEQGGASTSAVVIVSDQLAQGVSVPQLPDGNYRLRVRGVDALGLEGLDSEKAVTVRSHPVAAPPETITWRDVRVTDSLLVLRWTSAPPVALYQIQVWRLDTAAVGAPGTSQDRAESVDPRAIVLDELVRDTQLDLPVPGPGQYAVRVRRASELGKEPAWSDARVISGRAAASRWRGLEAPWVAR